MSVLIVYATCEGQARKIAEYIGRVMADAGHTADVQEVDDVPILMPMNAPEAVIIAASIHLGKHKASVARFIDANLALLRSVPGAFISVSMSACTPERQNEARRYVDTFLAPTRWEPDIVGLVGGALRYSQYGFFKKLMLRKIAADAGLPTDTTKDHEFTDWAQVDALAGEIVLALAQTARA